MKKNSKNNMNLNLAKSGLMLVVGGLICKLVGAFYRIPLSNILGAEGIGVYQILFPLYSFSLVFVSGGLTFALSKSVSSAIALKKENQISKYFMSALAFVLCVGGGFLALFVLLSGKLEVFQNVECAKFSYFLIGAAVVFSGLISVFRGLFQGYNHMASTVISQLIEQVVKLAFGLLLSSFLLKYGIYWAVFGALLGLVASEVFAFLYYLTLSVVMCKKKRMSFFASGIKNFGPERKQFFALSFPVLVSQIMLPLAFGIQSLVVVNLLIKSGANSSLAKSHYGVLSGMVNSLISFPAIIGASLAVALVPAISFLLAKKNKPQASVLVKNVYKAIWIVSLPCVVGLMFLSENILMLVFKDGLGQSLLPVASMLLKIASIQILFAGFVQVSTTLLQVLAKTWHAVFELFVFLVVNVVLMFLLTLKFGILGLCVANLIAYGASCFVGVLFLRNNFQTAFSALEVFAPIVVSGLMAVIILIFKNYFEIRLGNFWFLAITLFVCVVFYFGVLFVLKVIKKQDFLIKNKNA